MRRVRPALIAAAAAAVLVVAAGAALWHQRELWSEGAANYLRQRLAEELGAEFHAARPRVRWLPPRVSLGRVTLHRRGEPWVLEGEDLRISFNLYAVLFGRERLGRVVLVRPRLFVRGRAESAGPAPGGAAPEARRGPPPLPLPFRLLEVEDGRLDYRRPGGELVVAEGIDLLIDVARGEARGRLLARRVAVEQGGRRLDLGSLTAGASVAGGTVTVRDLVLEGGDVPLQLSGSAGLDGSLALEGTAVAGLGLLSAIAGGPEAGGKARFAGKVGGSWRSPVVSGSLSLIGPSLRGTALPDAAGRVELRPGRISLENLRGTFAAGSFSLSGETTVGEGTPSWRLAASASGLDPSRAPLPDDSPLRSVGVASGTLEASGTGVSWPGMRARATFSARGPLAAGQEREVQVAGDAEIEGGVVRLVGLRAASSGVELSGAGTWSREEGFAGTVQGEAADLGELGLDPAAGVAGRASFAGDLLARGRDARFEGTLALEDLGVGSVRGVRARAHAVLTPTGLALAAGEYALGTGGGGTFSGSVALPDGGLDLDVRFEELELAEAAGLLGTGVGLAGKLAGAVSVRGPLGAPSIEGTVRGGHLRVGAAVLDEVAASLAWDGRRLDVRELRAARGGSTLVARGTIAEGRIEKGSFEAPALALSDLLPDAGVEAAGRAAGTIEGPLRAPQVRATFAELRLRAGAAELPAGDLEVELRAGVVTARGWVGARENRLRAVLEPAFGWRFEADLQIDRLSSDALFAAGVRRPRGFGRTGFLASGRLRAAGMLRSPEAIEADLELDSLWFEGAGRTLQNTGPVRITWRDGVLSLGDLELAGDQYRLRISGSAGPRTGWAIAAEGRVSLGLFQDYWDELVEIEGAAEVLLAVGGPWEAPELDGTIAIADGFVRARSLPEPLEGASGRIELHGRTIVATALEGTIAGSPFRGRGSYDIGRDHLDAEVEGRLDLALFRSRLPVAREMRGPMEVRLRLEGPIAATRFSGAVEVLGAELSLRPLSARITGVRGRVSLGPESLEVRDLTGTAGSGSLRLAGAMTWGGARRRADFELAARDVLLSLAGVAKVQADVDLGLHGDFDDLALRGEVTVLKGRYLLDFGEKPPRLGGGEEQGPPERGMPDLGRMALDVRVRAADNVWVANSTAKIEAAIAVDVGGTVAEPLVSGEVTAIHGEAYYLSRYFRLESAVLRFTPPAKVPQLDLQASTAVGETQVLFLMDGPLDDLSFHLTSLPPLSQEDLISLLTVGQTRANLERRGDQASAMGAAVFSSEPIVNALGDTARTELGLEVLQLEPIVGEDSQVSARLTLGTHLSDRLFVSYTQNLGETEDQQFRVEYSILDYLALWGRQMRQGIYSLDLVFRYAFR